MGIKHTFVSPVASSTNTDIVRPTNWNADHTIDGDVDFNGYSITDIGNAQVLNLRDFGAVGNGITSDVQAINDWLDAGWVKVLASGDPSLSAIENRTLYAPRGRYRISEPISILGAHGAKMFGDGRFATQFYADPGVTPFITNGCDYASFYDFGIFTSGAANCFELNWLNDGYVSLQSNTFSNIFFSGGEKGLRIGENNMGSENLILNCYFIGQTDAALTTENFNALQNVIVGGNIASGTGGVGVRVDSGSVTNIVGVGFQNNDLDITVANSANDLMTVTGCRTESSSFIYSAWAAVCARRVLAADNYGWCFCTDGVRRDHHTISAERLRQHQWSIGKFQRRGRCLSVWSR